MRSTECATHNLNSPAIGGVRFQQLGRSVFGHLCRSYDTTVLVLSFFTTINSGSVGSIVVYAVFVLGLPV